MNSLGSFLCFPNCGVCFESISTSDPYMPYVGEEFLDEWFWDLLYQDTTENNPYSNFDKVAELIRDNIEFTIRYIVTEEIQDIDTFNTYINFQVMIKNHKIAMYYKLKWSTLC